MNLAGLPNPVKVMVPPVSRVSNVAQKVCSKRSESTITKQDLPRQGSITDRKSSLEQRMVIALIETCGSREGIFWAQQLKLIDDGCTPDDPPSCEACNAVR